MKYIIDTMNFSNIAHAVRANVLPSLDYQMDAYNNKLRRYIIKNKSILKEERHYFNPISYTKGNMTIHLVGCSHGAADYKLYGLTFIVYATFTYRGKLYAAMLTGMTYNETVILTPHMLDRYQERLDIENTTREELILSYLKNNATTMTAPNNIPAEIFSKYNNENSVFIGVKEGAVIGEAYGEHVIIAKTFVSHQLLHDNQQKTSSTLALELMQYNAYKYAA